MHGTILLDEKGSRLEGVRPAHGAELQRNVYRLCTAILRSWNRRKRSIAPSIFEDNVRQNAISEDLAGTRLEVGPLHGLLRRLTFRHNLGDEFVAFAEFDSL